MPVKMIHCSRRDAKVLAKYGHTVYAEVDGDLNPSNFFTMEGGTLVSGTAKAGVRGQRRPNRGHIPSTAFLKLTGTPPKFSMRATTLEACYIATRDKLTQKKYKGKIQRRELEDYLIKKLDLGSTHVASTISQLIYVKKGLEVAE